MTIGLLQLKACESNSFPWVAPNFYTIVKKLLLFFSLAVCGNVSFCQLLSSDQIYNKVVFLYERKGDKINSGSGFLVTGGERYFLVTARHVADSLTIERAHICFRNEEDYKPIDHL